MDTPTNAELFEVVQAWACGTFGGDFATKFTLKLSSGQKVSVPVPRPSFRSIEPPKLNSCSRDLLDYLDREGKRQTTSQIIAALADGHGQSTIEKAIQSLRKGGLIDNVTDSDAFGKGYGLPEWTGGGR